MREFINERSLLWCRLQPASFVVQAFSLQPMQNTCTFLHHSHNYPPMITPPPRAFLFPLFIFTPFVSAAAPPNPNPEDTEVWDPTPVVVPPGPAISIAPPSDAIILFD